MFSVSSLFSALHLIQHHTFPLTSVALSAWSLMLIKSCSFPSDPRLIEDSRALLMVASGYEVVLWLGFLLPLGGCGPKMLSQFVSLSLDSLDAGSGCLEADEVRMLEDGKEDVVIMKTHQVEFD